MIVTLATKPRHYLPVVAMASTYRTVRMHILSGSYIQIWHSFLFNPLPGRAARLHITSDACAFTKVFGLA